MKKVYLAGPVVCDEKHLQEIYCVYQFLIHCDCEVYWPRELKIPNAWGINQEAWAQSVFTVDVLELNKCDWIVICDYGRNSTCGTAWEAGYAFGRNKKILLVQMPEYVEGSLMMTGCASNIVKYDNLDKEKDVFIERGKIQNNEVILN